METSPEDSPEERPLEKYDIELHAGPAMNTKWQETEELLANLYPHYFKAGTHANILQRCLYWERFKSGSTLKPDSPPNFLLLAKSVYASKLTLGFLAGGLDPLLINRPAIMVMGVLHDERRRGIGTALVKRYFAHTGYVSAMATYYRPADWEPFEFHLFMKSLKAEQTLDLATEWTYWIPNPGMPTSRILRKEFPY